MTGRKPTVYVDLDLMERYCHPIAEAMYQANLEPMVEFKDHEKDKLESALANPAQTFDGRELYPTFEKKAAILFYSLNKNHAFANSNKRISVATLLFFLALNGYWLSSAMQVQRTIFELAKKIASSEGTKEMQFHLTEIEKLLKDNLIENGIRTE